MKHLKKYNEVVSHIDLGINGNELEEIKKTALNKWVGQLHKSGFSPEEIDDLISKHSFHYIQGYLNGMKQDKNK